MENTLQQILQELKNVTSRLDHLEQGQENLIQGQNAIRFELSELKEGHGQLQKIIEHVEDKTSALNKRVFDVETEIQRILRHQRSSHS